MPHPALDQLAPALDTVRAASQARAWQVNWIVGELTTALDNGDLPPEARANARVLLTTEHLTTFLEHADNDAYRPRARTRTHGPSPWSARNRRAVLRAICRAAHLHPGVVPRTTTPDARGDALTPRQKTALWSFVADAHLYVPRTSARRLVLIRMAAITGIVMDTGALAGEVTHINRYQDLTDDCATVHITHRTQGPGGLTGVRTPYRLSEKTTNAIRRWLPYRDELSADVEGQPITSLWVTVRPGGRGPRTARAGMPLSTRTLRDQYQAVVDWLNEARADDADWTPIPASLERLRLSGTPVVAHPHTTRPVR
ncbi:hypothetical protein ACWDTQ_31170 [Streptomyces cellulosae]